MKRIFILFSLLCPLFLAVVIAGAQPGGGQQPPRPIRVTVTVTDAIGPVIGAGVLQKGTDNGAVTDSEGKAVINVPADAVLAVTCLGYADQELAVNGKSELSVNLKEDNQELEETVVIGYGVQKKESLTSAITQIGSDDIVTTRTTDAVEALQGKVPGLLIREKGSRPGEFNTDLSLRGYGTPMIVVDGIVRSGQVTKAQTGMATLWGGTTKTVNDISVLQEINPDDIESISVLKDASATIYGLGAQNGVILITTKKGRASKPSVSWSSTLRLSQPTRIRDVEDWTSFMKWDNAMSDNGHMNHRYSDEVIESFEKGDGKYNYTDWYKETTRKLAVTHNHNLSVSGGSDRVTYRLSLGYAEEGSNLRTDNYKYGRYNLSANVTVKLTDNLSAKYNASMLFANSSTPGEGGVDMNIWYYIYATDPMIGVHPINNAAHYSNVNEQMNTIALLDPEASGYLKIQRNSYQNTLQFDYDAPFLKGLNMSLTGAYDYGVSKTRNLIKNFDCYDYYTDEYVASFRSENSYSETWIDNSRLYGRVQATYNQTFGKHHVGGTIAGEVTKNGTSNLTGKREYGASHAESFYTHDTMNSGLASTATNGGTRNNTATAGYIGRATYDYAGKYLVEVMARYDGTYYYAPGKRWGFFPSYSLGWRVSEEKFFRNILPKVNNFKLRWSDGKTGSVQGSPYAYIAGYTGTGTWVMNQGSTTKGWNSTTVENTILTWADVRMVDFGVDLEIWQGKLGASFDWFKRITDGTAATRTVSLPDFYGVSLPQENLNANEVEGLELSISHRNRIGQFNYSISANATYSRSRQTRIVSEETRTYNSSMAYWQGCMLGRWSNARSASTYHWAGGQFTSLGDASGYNVLYDTNLNKGNQAILPGMYKIEDRDGNGYIDSNDMYYTWSESNPPLQFGLLISGSWKNLDFSLAFNGASLCSKEIKVHGFAGFGYLYYLPSEYAKDCYHVAQYGADPFDPNTEWVSGYWPALTRVTSTWTTHNATYLSNQPYNFVPSTYLRLKSIEIGYRLSPSFLKKAGVKSCRLFFNGGNLLTLSNKLLRKVDPESVDGGQMGGTFSIMKSYNFGVNLNF